MKRLTALIISLCCICFAAEAKLVLSNLCSDGMVLQQNSDAKVWGTAAPGAQITVTPSWNGTAYRTKAGQDGCWAVNVSTPAGSYKSYSMTVKGDGGTIRIKDILVGEVWLASGQSNMEMPMRGFYNCPVEDALEYISAPAATEKIRMFTVPVRQSYEPLTEVDGKWNGAQSSTIPDMSATAFFFARELNEMLDIPVGIISCAYGGARIESWTPKEILETYPDMDLRREKIESMVHYSRPYLAYNAMLNPVKGYTIKGFIWYQGCSNVGKHEQFCERMTNMVNHWRECWNDKDASLPFYMVELAPYRNKPHTEIPYFALLRQAQHEAAKVIPNSGIIVTNDLVASYEQDNIHPAKKKEVGERLAHMALNRNYGFKRISCDSPEAVRCYRMANSCELAIELTNTPNGLSRWMEIEGLEVAGSEGIFYPVTYAYFEWEPKVLRIRSEFVWDPCVVRYGWGDFKPGNLKNVEGLPVAPFQIRVEE
ncbi:MAG: sialate O-acetylesterase [Bacteroidales bacterium]|nr:sialate O-acetylesterase [Bacteroidales bacterium]